MADTVKSKAIEFATLGEKAIEKITDNLLFRANRKLESLIPNDIYAEYSVSSGISADTITSIELGKETTFTISTPNYRKEGSFVYISGIIDKGLYGLNGKHEISPVVGSEGSKFTIDIDTSQYEGCSYTSGGTVVDAVWEAIQDAEAYVLLSLLIPTCIDIKIGDIGVLPSNSEWGQGNTQESKVYELQKLSSWYMDMALEVINGSIGDGINGDIVSIIAI